MGNRSAHSNNPSSVSTKRSGKSKIPQDLACPICKIVFKAKRSSYDEIDEHMEAHAEEELQAASKMAQLPEDKHFPEAEARIAPVRERLSHLKVPWSVSHVDIRITREAVIHDSLNQLFLMPSAELRSEFHILFNGEYSQDAGGLTKEWLGLLFTQLFSPELGLFCLGTGKEARYLPEKHNDSSEYYVLAGIALAKAVLENIPLNCSLAQSVLKHLLGLSCSLHDIKYQDLDIYNSLKFIQSNSITGVLFDTFSVRHNDKLYRIIDDGENIPLNEDTKEAYVLLRTEYEVYTSMYAAIEGLRQGFYKVIPQDYLQGLDHDDLDFMICGNPVINLRDWKDHTEYSGEYSPTHRVIMWFWDVVCGLSQEHLRDLLQFVTGTSRVPIEGFSGLRTLRGDPACFKIVSVEYVKGILPRAHTCFNRLDLPLYPSKSILRCAFENVIANHILGFGLD